MAIELTKTSIEKLCNGNLVRRPILQLLGYEAVELTNNKTNYRLVLSDGVHMNSYFYLCTKLHDLIVKKQVRYGTILRVDEYRFVDGENNADHSPRWVIFIQKVTVLLHRIVVGDPQPLTNIIKKKEPLINLNLDTCPSRMFDSIEQLENNLKSVQDLNNQPNGKCTFVLKLTVVKKYSISEYSRCRVLNINMEDSTGMVRVSAFNSLSDKINEICQENKTYYITDFFLKYNKFGCELKLQSYSVVIECIDQNVQSVKTLFTNFNILLENNPNKFCDLIGICINIGDVEVCCNSITQTEIAKREIVLIDTSMATITLKVWGEMVIIFDEKFEDPPVVMVKPAVIKQFNGVKHFSTIKHSVLLVNPNTTETQQLKEWYKEMFTIQQ